MLLHRSEPRLAALLAMAVVACKSNSGPTDGSGGASAAGAGGSGGLPSAAVGGAASASQSGAGGEASGSGGALPAPIPKYYPVPGFESCVHAEVKADCASGWCKLPPSCFVMGSPEGEWHRGLDSENQIAVTLTHAIEVQQKELTRAEWTMITGLDARGPDSCVEDACPVSMVSWWDAVHAANLLSAQKGLAACYAPVGCTGALGVDLACTGVAEPDKSVYECEGYRLPTRVEAEYAARAGTISTFYSGDITKSADSASCLTDPALEKIAWYCANSGERTHAGGGLQPNGLGLHDLIGNLGEWSNEEQQGSSSPGGMDPRGSVGMGSERLKFGGQHNLLSYLVRTAALSSAPSDSRAMLFGFRLVRTLPD